MCNVSQNPAALLLHHFGASAFFLPFSKSRSHAILEETPLSAHIKQISIKSPTPTPGTSMGGHQATKPTANPGLNTK